MTEDAGSTRRGEGTDRTSPIRIEVQSAGHAYPVVLEEGALGALCTFVAESVAAIRYAVIADERVSGLYGASVLAHLADGGLEASLFEFPTGERSKSRAHWAHLSDALIDAGFGRDSAVIALGGGVTGDLAGFVAATYMRGIPLVQVPTSLVAMVDASVGGKTGLDVPGGKNLVGAFHPPRIVVIDPVVAATLSQGQRAEGLVEAVKHGAIVDEPYLRHVEDVVDPALEGDTRAVASVVHGSVRIKAGIVGSDEHERGLRQVLNFGHTLGHGIEAASGYALSHGWAVGLGMILEARLGERLGVTQPGTSARLAGILRRLGVPDRIPEEISIDDVIAFVGRDKKARGGAPRYVLLEALGTTSEAGGWARGIEESDVRGVLALNY